jgi:hypothetical protein
MDELIKELSIVLLVCITLTVFAVILAVPTYLLWNWLLPELFNIKTITFIQAIGINMLSSILFKTTHPNKKEK